MRLKNSLMIASVIVVFCIIFILLHKALNETYTPKFRYVAKGPRRLRTEPQAPEVIRILDDIDAPSSNDGRYDENTIPTPSKTEIGSQNINFDYRWNEIEHIFDDFLSQISAPSSQAQQSQISVPGSQAQKSSSTKSTSRITHSNSHVSTESTTRVSSEKTTTRTKVIPTTTAMISTATQPVQNKMANDETSTSEQHTWITPSNLPSTGYEPKPSIPPSATELITTSTQGQLFELENSTISPYNCCNPNTTYPYRKNILFIKVHKCASSTVQNILMRFGLRNDLNFMLPYFFYITYYEPFKEGFMPAEIRTPDGKYNILTHHVRYWPNLKKSMYPDTISVTILRSPASVFEGMYNYFMLNYMLGKSFQEFLKSPENMQSPIKDTMPVYRGNNQMSMDLGLDQTYFENQTAIELFIEFVDREFDFVMIVEYFDESLVLFAHLMGWPLNHVAYVPVNRRHQGVKYQLTESDREVLSNLNRADTMLYNHFMKKFQKCRQQFGIQRLQNEVEKLKELNNALRERCVFAEHIVPIFGILGYDMKNFTDWDCIYSTKYEYFFTEELKFRQSQRILLNRTAHW